MPLKTLGPIGPRAVGERVKGGLWNNRQNECMVCGRPGEADTHRTEELHGDIILGKGRPVQPDHTGGN